MKKRIRKISVTVLAMVLSLSFCLAVPCAAASAEGYVKADTQSVKTQEQSEGIEDLFGGLGDLLGSDVLGGLLKVDWSIFFNKDYDWDALFGGDMSFKEMQDTKEWDALIDTVTGFIGNTCLSDEQLEDIADVAETKYYSVSVQEILEKLGKALKGDYNGYFDILNGDYSALLNLADEKLNSVIVDALKNEDISIEKLFGGDYTVLKDIIGGDYSYIEGLLEGDYTWITALLTKEDVNLEELFDELDRGTLEKLIASAGGEDKEVLAFVDGYYDQIVALINGDYSFISEIKDGKYEDMLELVKKLSELVGFEKAGNLQGIIGQLVSLNDGEINSIVRSLEVMLYDALPEEYRDIMTGLKDISDKLEDIASDVEIIKDTVIGIIGDIDLDEIVSMVDVVLVQRDIANINLFNEEEKDKADMDRDGKVTMVDVVMMQRVVAKLDVA